MGQNMSHLNEHSRLHSQEKASSSIKVVLPLSLRDFKTTIYSFGTETHRNPRFWYYEGGRKVCPFPGGYRATTELYGEQCTLDVIIDQKGCPIFSVTVKSGEKYYGATPTAAIAKYAIRKGESSVMNGMDVFGFSNDLVRQELNQLFGERSSPGHSSPENGYHPQGLNVQDLVDLIRGESNLLLMDSTGVPSSQEPRQPKERNLVSDSPVYPSTPKTHRLAIGSRRRQPRSDNAGLRWSSAVPSVLEALPDVDKSLDKVSTRSRGRASNFRGWTAYTAFGFEMRDKVRQQHPDASAAEVEKLVGQTWAQLPQQLKKPYVEAAAKARRRVVGKSGFQASQGKSTALPGDNAGQDKHDSDGLDLGDQEDVRLLTTQNNLQADDPESSDAPEARQLTNGSKRLYDTADTGCEPAAGPSHTALLGEHEIEVRNLPIRKRPRTANGRKYYSPNASNETKSHSYSPEPHRQASVSTVDADLEASTLAILASMRETAVASQSQRLTASR